MRALLMHRDRDFDVKQGLPRNERALSQDLELDTLFRAMASDDAFLLDVARKAVLSGLGNDEDTILYRQEILRDCLKNPSVARGLYDLAVEAIEGKKMLHFGIFSSYPTSILHDSIELLRMLAGVLEKLRGVAEVYSARFESEGFKAFFAMIEKELSDEYLATIRAQLEDLKLRKGVLLSAELGRGNEGTNYVLRKAPSKRRRWLELIFSARPPAYTFHLAERDEAGARALSELHNRGVNLVANALAQSVDHILGFFVMLRTELAFHVGCLNLYDRMAAKGEPTCFPRPEPIGSRRHRFGNLYDVCLALSMQPRVVSNTVDVDRKSLVIVTGANQGGKTTFLRSIGLAQLMMQCGMFVSAESFTAERCSALFTHYRREEDATMKSGKLDEELGRMSDIVDALSPDAMLLFNESFSATNEREGSEIARQIVRALLERRIKMFFVTHLYDFAHGVFDMQRADAMFLLAERRADGTRTFKLVEGEPLETSYGEDLYREIFEGGAEGRTGTEAAPARTAPV